MTYKFPACSLKDDSEKLDQKFILGYICVNYHDYRERCWEKNEDNTRKAEKYLRNLIRKFVNHKKHTFWNKRIFIKVLN